MNDNSNGGAPNRAEAERLLGVAEKLLLSRDFIGSKDFAVLAQETDPLLDGSDQILAIADVILSSDKKINEDHHDWYSILQLDPAGTDDADLIKKQYRRLALLLHPDKNKFPFADHAFKLVADAWAVLSDSSKKSPFDRDFNLYTKVDLSNAGNKLPVRRSQRHAGDNDDNNSPRTTVNFNSDSSSGDVNHTSNNRRSARIASFWTLCPYCYIMYEYPRVYEDCCLRCEKCERAFHAASIQSLPPMVPGKESYYCSWGFFPLGFVLGNGDKSSASDGGGNSAAAASGSAFVNWMPPMFGGAGQQQVGERNGAPPPPAAATPFSVVTPAVPQSTVPPSIPVQGSSSGVVARKRGRPRKNPLPGQT
ncbi:unnamed protein product [Linum tenue]|uniref:J domain-containing protein n=1 Tax=Linum tenue TaxID=586396 RepID=A0AAV0K614_9ROSI|nr:unnamed protein product [Linum tenue]